MAEGPYVRPTKKPLPKFTGSLESSGESSVVAVGSPSEYPVATLTAWHHLPDMVRNDPYLSPFRRGYERHLAPPVGTRRHSSATMPLSPVSEEDVLAGLLTDFTTDVLNPRKLKPWIRCLKVTGLFIIWLIFTVILMLKSEKVSSLYQITIPENVSRVYWILEHPTHNQASFTLQGPFLPMYYSNLTSRRMTVWLEELEYKYFPQLSANLSTFKERYVLNTTVIGQKWVIPLVSNKNLIDFVPEIKNTRNFNLEDINLSSKHSLLRLHMETNLDATLPVAISYDLTPINLNVGIIFAAVVLLGLYVFIVFEIIHRTLAAILASTMSIAILAALDERPTMKEVVTWIDIETVLLLFSMMMLVAVLTETGIFDYLAVFAFKITSGRVWPLVNTLCIFTALLSSFLDNVTTVLLMTPVTIRLCEVMELNPVPILMAMILYSNIGGALTPVGDPPNVIIASNSDIIDAGIDFSTFTIHMGVGVFLCLGVVYLQLRFHFRDIKDLGFKEPQDIQERRHEISVWQRAAASLSSYSKDEDIVRHSLLKRVRQLQKELKINLCSGSEGIDTYRATLEELQAKYPIRDKILLIKSSVALLFVIVFFFLHSIPSLKLSLGWTALLGAILLLLLADNENFEGVLARVEWGTLLFFAALFVLMESLSRLGLIDWIGWQTERIILSVDESSRLAVAILLILWVSAAASSFVDNIPLTTMMVRIVTSLAQNEEMDLPLQPLVWALAFGACLGGNGTLIGSSSNVVCAGVAEQHGYRFTFMQYAKVGFPVMVVSVFVASVYLLLAHVVFTWH